MNLRIAYYDQARAAKIRGIEFLLTFDEWLKEWEDSGHLHERGRRRGQYCMSRPGDKGPYAVGNIRIVVVGDNHREAHKGKPIRAEVLKARIGKKRSAAFCESARIRSTGRVMSAESRAKSSATQKGRPGKPHTAETIHKMSEIRKLYYANKRAVRMHLRPG